jgi:hypothetical protein
MIVISVVGPDVYPKFIRFDGSVRLCVTWNLWCKGMPWEQEKAFKIPYSKPVLITEIKPI